MSYHTGYSNWDPQAVVFVFVFLHMCSNNCLHLIVKILYITTLQCFYLSWELSWCRVSVLKEDLQFSTFFKNTICIGLCKLQCAEKRFIPYTPLIFSLSLPPIQNLKEDLNMPSRMYSTIHLLEIMRLSAFKSPLFYPSSQECPLLCLL